MARKIEKKHRGVYEAIPGSGVWWVHYYADRQRKREKVGRKSDAIALYQQRKSEIRAGAKLPHNMRFKGERLAGILDRAADWYRTHGKWSRVACGCLNVIKQSLGDRVADDLTAHDVDRWLSAHTKWSPATANRYKSVLSRALQLALESGHVERNVARLVTTRREDNKRVRYLLPDEETKLRAVMSPELTDMVEFALHSGARKGEEFKLTWDDVDFDRRKVTFTRTKTGGDREVPMTKTCERLLRRLYENRTGSHDRVFSSTVRDAPIKNPRQAFETALRRAGIKNFRYHDLRHTFASRLVMRGVGLYEVSKLLGHGSVVTTQRYAHLAPEHLAGAVDVLDAQAT
jgi:integrase